MPKNIKITEEQYKILMEADEDMFPYVTNSPFKPFDGYNNITPEGNKEGEEKADSRTTGDMIQQMRTMDGIDTVHMVIYAPQL